MDFQLRRPYSAKSRLESAQPLTATSPVHKAPPARSHSQSGGGSLAQYNAERIQSLGDSARAHGSPSKTLKTRTTTRSQPQPRTDAAVRPPHSATCSSAFVRLLLVGVLFCWQGLVLLVLGLTLHTAKGINHQISLTGAGLCQNCTLRSWDITNGFTAAVGAYGVKLSLDQGWLNNLQDSRLSHNITTTGVSRTDVYALHASNTTFVRLSVERLFWVFLHMHYMTLLAQHQ